MVLDAFTQVLGFSPSMAATVDDMGPEHLKNSLKLHTFILHSNKAYSASGLKAVAKLVATCPKFADPKSFVDASNAKVHIMLATVLQEVTPAKSLPTLDSLTIDLQKSVQMKFGTTRRRNDVVKKKLTALFGEEYLGGSEEPDSDPQAAALEVAAALLGDSNLSTAFSGLTVEDHVHQMQEELLNDDEREIRATVALTHQLYKKASKEKNSAEMKGQFENLMKLQRALVGLHLERRDAKMKRLKERLVYLEGLLQSPSSSHPKETLEAYKKNVDLQDKSVKLLDSLYSSLTEAINFTHVTGELMFLDRQISTILEVSFSVVVTGLISVGKSTFVNCITGRNLCPNRLDTMTAIPTNYVHDPKAKEPIMVVPFFEQLNRVLDVSRQLLAEFGKKGILEATQGASHIAALLDKIAAGLIFKGRYQGAAEILECSTCIHDVFRFAVMDAVAESLAPHLPLDWSQGLDSYLTVFVCFPRADIATGLVNFSIVDTPGINEFGVQKLKLTKTIRDTLTVCSYGVLVMTRDSHSAQDIAPLKQAFSMMKKKYHLPMAGVVTHAEDFMEANERAQVLQSTSDGLKPDKDPVSIMEVSQIHPISGARYALALEMQAFLTSAKRKPELTSQNSQEKVLADNYTQHCAKGDDRDDRIEYYNSCTLEQIVKDTERAMKSSGVTETISNLLQFAVRDGIKVLVQSAFQKTADLLKAFVTRYQNLNEEKAIQAEQKIHAATAVLEGKKNEMKTQLALTIKFVKGKVASQAAEAQKDLETVLETNLPATTAVILSTLTDHLRTHVNKIKDGKTRDIVCQNRPVVFPSEQAIKEAQSTLPLHFKISIKQYFWIKNSDTPAEQTQWMYEKKKAILVQVKIISDLVQDTFKISVDDDLIRALNYPDLDNENMDFSFRAVKKRGDFFGLLDYFLPPGNAFVVEPKEVRKRLLTFGTTSINELSDHTQKALETQIQELVNTFLVSVSKEVTRMTEKAGDVSRGLAVNKSTEPIRACVKSVETTLQAMAALSASIQ